MTGAKVFSLEKFFDEDTVIDYHPDHHPFTGSHWRGSPSVRSKPRSIPLSQLFYGQNRVHVVKTFRTVYLSSPQRHTLWVEARLDAKLVPGSRVGPGNGIHAYRTLRQAVTAYHDADHRIDHPGEQAAYAILQPEGEVVIGEYGWVAETATIIRIFLWPQDYLSFAPILYDRYKVPVEVLPASLRQSRHEEPKRPLETLIFPTWNRRYGPESGARLLRIRKILAWKLALPRTVRRPARIALWDPAVAAIGKLRMDMRQLDILTPKQRGRLGGLARAKLGKVRISGAAVPKPTPCPRCGHELPSARQAWRHCRKGKPGRPKKSLTP